MKSQGVLMVCVYILSERNNGSNSYVYISISKSWYDARSYCRQYYTDLASTRNTTEYTLVNNMVSTLTVYTWIGLLRDPWKWADQTNFSTISWMTGYPNNALGQEDCGYLTNGQAADARCSDILPFFCYSGESYLN